MDEIKSLIPRDNFGIEKKHTSEIRTILILFIILRLTLLFLFTPQGLLNAFTDYHFYFQTALLSEQGLYPFYNMWYEYPPLSTYIVEGVYSLARIFTGGLVPPDLVYRVFESLLGSLLLVFDAGTLLLIHKLVVRFWDEERANWTAWVFTTLSLPIFFWNATHTSIMVFFSLLSLYLFLEEKTTLSAFALGLGIAAKITPAILILPALRLLFPKRWQASLGYVVVALTTGFAFYIPFLLLGSGAWVMASFRALGKVGSWSTIWALINGNWRIGDFGMLAYRMKMDLAAIPHARPEVVPESIKLILFGLLFAWLFFRASQLPSGRQYFWFAALTIMIFHLWSKGWSPQWATWIIPFVLVTHPNKRGLGYILALTALCLIEWPLYDALGLRPLLVIAILGRTGLFLYLTIRFAQQIYGSKSINSMEPVATAA